MKKGFMVLGMLVALAACEEATQAEKNADVKRIMNNHLQYVQDTRTGICFARAHGHGGFSFSQVPCTDQVKALLVNTAE